ncbi:MAG: hypothetical protein AB1467_06295 [Candidatus Diapherotrites archaeon]
MKKILLLAGFLALVIAAGCIKQPLSSAELTKIYFYKSDGTMTIKHIYYGELSADSTEWEQNCTEALQGQIDSIIEDAKSKRTTAKSEEEFKKLNNSIAALELIKGRIECSLQRDNALNLEEKAKITATIEMDKDFIKKIRDLNAGETDYGITREEGGGFTARIPLKENISAIDLFAENITKKTIKIKVEGDVSSIKPEGYTIEDNYYVFRNPEKFKEEFIELNYKLNAYYFLVGYFLPAAVLIGLMVILIIVALSFSGKKKVGTTKTKEEIAKPVKIEDERRQMIAEKIEQEKKLREKISGETEKEKKPQKPLSPEDQMEQLKIKLTEVLRKEIGSSDIKIMSFTKVRDNYLAKVEIVNELYFMDLDSKFRIIDFKKM